MEKEAIIQKFKEKGFNEETITYLLGAIQEFEMFLSQYLSTEEVVERICQNLNNNIEFLDFSDVAINGSYSYQDKKIQIDVTQDDEAKKRIFFHEFLHCITSKKIENGYMCGFCSHIILILLKEVYVDSERRMKEGIIAYLTEKRNMIVENKKSKSYESLKQQIEILVQIIPEEKLLDCLFNKPEKLEELFKEYNLDYQCIMVSLDEIYVKVRDMNLKKALLNTLNFEDELENPKRNLFSHYMESFQNINSLEKLKRELDFFHMLKGKIDSYNVYKVFTKLMADMQSVKEGGVTEEEIDELVQQYGLKEELGFVNRVNEFFQMDSTSVAIELSNLNKNDNKDIWVFNSDFSNPINNFLFESYEGESSLSIAMTIGRFLSENPEIDLNEVKITKIAYKNATLESEKDDFEYCSFYLLETESGKIDILGEYGTGERKKKSDKIFEFQEEEFRPIKIRLKGGKVLIFAEGQEPQEGEIEYVQQSNLSICRERVEIYEKNMKKYEEIKAPNVLKIHAEESLKQRRLELKKMEDEISHRKEKVLQDLILEDKTWQKRVDVANEIAVERESTVDMDLEEKDN